MLRLYRLYHLINAVTETIDCERQMIQKKNEMNREVIAGVDAATATDTVLVNLEKNSIKCQVL